MVQSPVDRGELEPPELRVSSFALNFVVPKGRFR